ncbi:MAG: MarR family transcriptional regulator [Actinomycetota bacterium]|nr:MarR family transcriptional regulator [Actinomycetota bacterium]
MAGPHTLAETERAVESRLSDMNLDFEAMAVTSNLFRAANAVRNRLEGTVLKPHDLTWTAFVVLWVTWIWEEVETRIIAEEGGFSKATLSGVLATLERRGLVVRERSADDGRLVIVRLSPAGRRLMRRLFPLFNQQEQAVVAAIPAADRPGTAEALRRMTVTASEPR